MRVPASPKSLAARLRPPPPERRCGVSVPRAAWRTGLSLARRRWARSPVTAVDLDGFRVQADLRTPLGLSLFRYGFCAPEARVCSALLRPGDVFVDGGANIGLFSLRAATIVGPTGRIVACEPSPGTMELLRANVTRNGFSMTELHEVALSDAVGTTQFTVFEDGSGLASFAPQSIDGRVVDVEVTTLDELTATFGNRVAVVKLDIEGAEVKALRGASGLIQRAAPLFVIEVEPGHLARQGSSIDDLAAALRPRDYEAYAITPDARLTKLAGSWHPPDPSRPNLVLAAPSRASRLQHLVGPA